MGDSQGRSVFDVGGLHPSTPLPRMPIRARAPPPLASANACPRACSAALSSVSDAPTTANRWLNLCSSCASTTCNGEAALARSCSRRLAASDAPPSPPPRPPSESAAASLVSSLSGSSASNLCVSSITSPAELARLPARATLPPPSTPRPPSADEARGSSAKIVERRWSACQESRGGRLRELLTCQYVPGPTHCRYRYCHPAPAACV